MTKSLQSAVVDGEGGENESETVDERTKLNHDNEHPSIKIMSKMSEKYQLERAAAVAACKKRMVSRIKVLWAFISFLISLTDVTVILVVAYLHFIHAHDVMAWLMLFPILLNFIGIFTFLSNENERRELEDLAGSCRASTLVKNLMILPVVGPSFASLRLFAYAIQEKDAEKFERLESLLTKMKQYESFFRASPEAFIQMTYRIVSWQADRPFDYEDYWTITCLALCVFALAESNFYGVVRPYYRIFTDPAKLPEDAWSTEKVSIGWRVLLFFYTYFSILSRLLSDAVLRATIYFVFKKYYEHDISFGEVIAMTLITQFITRATFHIFVLRPRENLTMMSGEEERNEKAPPITARTVDYESGPLIYRAFTYSWRSIFMAFDFQNPDRYIATWFFIENLIMLVTAYSAALAIEYNLHEKSVYFVYTGGALGGMAVAFAIRLAVYCWWKKPYARARSRKVTPPPQAIVVDN